MKLTEAKLKQLINEVLEEGMKTIDDLPEGVFIKIDGAWRMLSTFITPTKKEGR